MILAVDVGYSGNTATVAGVLFKTWDGDTPARTLIATLDHVADYVPGQFYLRELPCIGKLLEQIDVPLDCIIIDGYVTLGGAETPGLGWKLWEHLGQRTPVIGVAKSAFPGTPEKAKLYRGDSTRPLFVTAVGMPLDHAKAHVADMHGAHRLPDLLTTVDRLSQPTNEGTDPP